VAILQVYAARRVGICTLVSEERSASTAPAVLLSLKYEGAESAGCDESRQISVRRPGFGHTYPYPCSIY